MNIHKVQVRDNTGRIIWEGGVSGTLLAIFKDAMTALDYSTTEEV